ncbi:porin family protein [Vibrio quintilis]|nr:porin family protein [Vibrio quintilis]
MMLIVMATSAQTNAQGNAIGAEVGLGSLKYDKASGDDSTDVSWTGSLYYERSLMPYLGISFGLHTGDGSSIKTSTIGSATKEDAKLDYTAASVSAVTYLNLFQNHRLYGSLGLNYNNVELTHDSSKLVDDDGFGYVIRAGWEYQISEPLSVNLGLQYLSMEDVDLTTTNFGVKMRF